MSEKKREGETGDGVGLKVEKFRRSSGRLTVDEELEEYSKLVKGKRRAEEKQEQRRTKREVEAEDLEMRK